VSEAEELLSLAVEAARMAGDLLSARAGRGAERDVRAKSTPTDLVSEADISSERTIRELLARRRPRDGFVGEEQGGGEAGDSGLQWVVDPLDGTINYLFGIPQWCVSVAVRDRERTLAGAVYDPNRDELFTATCESTPMLARGESAERLDRSEAAGDGVELSKVMLATGLAYDARVRDIRRFGSAALDLAWTAAGRFDAYFERSVKQWDIAAGALLCERAGLSVLELPVHPDLPWGILAAPPALAELLMQLVGGP